MNVAWMDKHTYIHTERITLWDIRILYLIKKVYF